MDSKRTKPAKKQSKKVGEGIYVLDSNKEAVKEINNNSKIVYTMVGHQDEILNGQPILLGEEADKKDLAYAKKEIRDGQEHFYIKFDETGVLLNPLSPAPLNNSWKSKVFKGENLTNFNKVNQKCFEQYLIFLKTSNKLHYTFAERERYNG